MLLLYFFNNFNKQDQLTSILHLALRSYLPMTFNYFPLSYYDEELYS